MLSHKFITLLILALFMLVSKCSLSLGDEYDDVNSGTFWTHSSLNDKSFTIQHSDRRYRFNDHHCLLNKKKVVFGERDSCKQRVCVYIGNEEHKYFGNWKNVYEKYQISQKLFVVDIYDQDVQETRNNRLETKLYDIANCSVFHFAYDKSFYLMLFNQIIRFDHTIYFKPKEFPFRVRFVNVTEELSKYAVDTEKCRVLYVQEKYEFLNGNRTGVTNNYRVSCGQKVGKDSMLGFKFFITDVVKDEKDDTSAVFHCKIDDNLELANPAFDVESYKKGMKLKEGDTLHLPNQTLKITRITHEHEIDGAIMPAHVVVSKIE